MRIQFVIGSLGCGGAELQLLMLMRGVKSQGHAPQLFVLNAKGPLRQEIEALGIPIVDGRFGFEGPAMLKAFHLLLALFRLWRHLRITRPAAVHGLLPLANLLTALAGRLAGVPVVVTGRRALNRHQDRVPGWRYLDMLSGRLSHVVTANSEAVRADTLLREGGNPASIRVIHNGLDAARFQQHASRQAVRRSLHLEDADEVVMIVANLIPYKGHAELLQALARLVPTHPRLRLLVVGEDRGIMAELQQQAHDLGIAAAVQWLGLRQDVPELLSVADVYVCASHEEGFSNALLEALAAGRAVVATCVGGNPEMLEQGALGVLVEPGSVEDLAAALADLLNDPARRESLGNHAAVRVAQRYGMESMVAQYLDLYRGADSAVHDRAAGGRG